MTKLTVSVMVESIETALARAGQVADLGADMVEYRVDRHPGHDGGLAVLVEQSPLPCIVTCRPKWEGGEFEGDESARIGVLESCCRGAVRPAYLDFELAAYQRSAQTRKRVDAIVAHPGQTSSTETALILSSHDFTGRPADLAQRVQAMEAAPACAVIKIAWQAGSIRDNIDAFKILNQATKPVVALCMGEYGLPSRVLAKKYNAFLTFAAIREDEATAPGQPTLRQIKDLYHWDRLNALTRVYGVIGYPVGHSMSPAVHNAGFDATGTDAVYLPLPIAPGYEPFAEAMDAWLGAELDPALTFSGASVTIPHKENLLSWARSRGGRVDELAEQIGAGNTLTVQPDGSFEVHNTDCQAAIGSVCDAMGIGLDGLRGKRVAVIGAGGVARAIILGFARQGSTVVIYNRTKEKADALAEQINQTLRADIDRDQVRPAADGAPAGKVVAARLDKLCDSCCHIFVNCTPLGMHPDVDVTPISAGQHTSKWGTETVVFDTVYNPPETRLLREAKAAGCATVPGIEMFVRQAARQSELWNPASDRPAILQVFREVVSSQLRAR